MQRAWGADGRPALGAGTLNSGGGAWVRRSLADHGMWFLPHSCCFCPEGKTCLDKPTLLGVGVPGWNPVRGWNRLLAGYVLWPAGTLVTGLKLGTAGRWVQDSAPWPLLQAQLAPPVQPDPQLWAWSELQGEGPGAPLTGGPSRGAGALHYREVVTPGPATPRVRVSRATFTGQVKRRARRGGGVARGHTPGHWPCSIRAQPRFPHRPPLRQHPTGTAGGPAGVCPAQQAPCAGGSPWLSVRVRGHLQTDWPAGPSAVCDHHSRWHGGLSNAVHTRSAGPPEGSRWPGLHSSPGLVPWAVSRATLGVPVAGVKSAAAAWGGGRVFPSF